MKGETGICYIQPELNAHVKKFCEHTAFRRDLLMDLAVKEWLDRHEHKEEKDA